MRLLAALVAVLRGSAASSVTAAAGAPALSVAVNSSSGVYTVAVDGKAWYMSPPDLTLCVAGKQLALTLKSTSAASGSDAFGAWSGTTASFTTAGGAAAAVMDVTFKLYTKSTVVVGTASFPTAISTAGCGANTDLSTQFPAFSTSAGRATELHTLSWRGDVIATTAAATGLGPLGASGLDCGPVASTDPETGVTLVISTLDNHKILPQKTSATNAHFAPD
jgi:hypothetical protein|eukprot:COSAG06_NODE_1194_length_10319_cov_2.663503_4_plen_221_part_00